MFVGGEGVELGTQGGQAAARDGAPVDQTGRFGSVAVGARRGIDRGVEDVQIDAARGRIGAEAVRVGGKLRVDRADGDAFGTVTVGGGHQLAKGFEVAEAAIALAPQRVQLDSEGPGATHVGDGQSVFRGNGQDRLAAAGFERVIAGDFDGGQGGAAGRGFEHAAAGGTVLEAELVRAGLDGQPGRKIDDGGDERGEVAALLGQGGAAFGELVVGVGGEAE